MRKGDYIPVLDHGYVQYVDSMGNDEMVIEAARMSTNKGFEGWFGPDGTPKDINLLEFLWMNSHTTPFEMGVLQIEVKAPLFVFREWHRHRTHSYNEMSARYVQMPNEHYLPDPSRIQKQSTANKQGSAEAMPEMFANETIHDLKNEQEAVYQNYDRLVQEGVAKEIARINTPVSRYSRMRDTANLLNWMKFLGLRMAPNAQYEIRMYANAVSEIVKEIWPRSYELFLEHSLFGQRFSRTEMLMLKELINSHLGPELYEMWMKAAPEGYRSERYLNRFLGKLGVK